MKKFSTSFLLIFIICQYALPQIVLKGKVVNAESQKPVPAVSVYLSNTSLGTFSNEQGLFFLKNIPSGKFKLIATCVGFATWSAWVNTREWKDSLVISLKPTTLELEGVEVIAPDPNGWVKWGKLFRDIFLGTTPHSVDCHLDNPEVLRFRLNADNTLTVSATKPIVIKNYWLGYRINYELEEFEYDFQTGVVHYQGYAFFSDLSLIHPAKAAKYQQERLKAYRGSLLHFMRAFYINQLEPEGFEIRSLTKIYNPEKRRAKKMLELVESSKDENAEQNKAVLATDDYGMTLRSHLNADSIKYFKKALLLPDSILSNQLLLADSIGFAVDSSTAAMYSSDSLQIAYKLDRAPAKYKAISKTYKTDSFQVSQFVFVPNKAVSIVSSGNYYSSDDLKITGYWAWWGNMTTKLPYDYAPSSPRE
jgi:hypothetical protein